MTFKDRTQEFNSVAESIRSKQLNAKSQWKTPKHQKSQFMLSASQIGKDIYETSEKLNKLTKLAKSATLFENHTVEIEELTFIIKQDIQNLNRQISTLKDLSSSKGSAHKQGEAHSKTVIGYLNARLADTTKGFKDILQVRTENLKVQQERRDRFTGGAMVPHTGAAGSGSASGTRFSGHGLGTLPDSSSGSGGEVAISMPGGVLLTQEYTSSRTAAVESIEKTLGELQGIFSDLIALVAEQGDSIQRLDANIENTSLYVDRGHSALLEHIYNISGNRGLIIKLFIVLIVFVILFVVFIV